MSGPERPTDDAAQRRRRAVRTALLFGGIAVAVYLGFLLTGVVGR